MKRLLILGLLYCPVWGQTPVTVQFGGLFCGAIQRPPNEVQTYCYIYPQSASGWTLVQNSILTLPSGQMTVSIQEYLGETIVWMLTNTGSSISYQYSTSSVNGLKTGILPTAQVIVDCNTAVLGWCCLVLPCCARADLCGKTAEQAAQDGCTGG